MTLRTNTLTALVGALLFTTPAMADEFPIAEATVEAIYARVMTAGAAHARAEGWSVNGAVHAFEHGHLDIYQGDKLSLGSHSYNGGSWVYEGALQAIVDASQDVAEGDRAAFQERALAFTFARQVAKKSDIDDGKDLDPHAVGIYARTGLAAPSKAELDVAIAILTETRVRALGPSHGMEFFFTGIRRKMRERKVNRKFGSAKKQHKRYAKLVEDANFGATGIVGALN